MKIMLDVGSRNGESVEEFVNWDFDVIHAFEPMPEQYGNIVERFGDETRVVVHNFGLSDVTAMLPVYGADQQGEASIFPTKADLDNRVVTTCEFVDASEFFRDNVSGDDDVLMKLNCEGSEVAILNNLLDSGEIWKVRALRVEMDISRCVGHEHEADAILDRLTEEGFYNVTVGSDARIENGVLVDRVVQEGSHHDRLRKWLTTCV